MYIIKYKTSDGVINRYGGFETLTDARQFLQTEDLWSGFRITVHEVDEEDNVTEVDFRFP